MNRQFYVAIFLAILFTAATVIADFDPEGVTEESVSASAGCGFIEFPNGKRILHVFDNITPIVYSSGCTHNVPAIYNITQKVKVEGSTDEFARVKVVTEATVLCSCGYQVMKRSASKIDTVDGWSDWFLNINRSFTVEEEDTFEVRLHVPATYTVNARGKGAAIVGGLGGQIGASANFSALGFGVGFGGSGQGGHSTTFDATWDEGMATTTFTVDTNDEMNVSEVY